MTTMSILLALLVSNAAEGDLLADLTLLEIVRAEHRAQENTGYVFLLTDHGKIVLADHAGLAVVEHEVPIDRTSRFPIMSITKAFTGMALAQAVADGLIDLDQPIGTYLATYPGPGADRITARMLASHTAGIPHLGHPGRRDLYVRHFDDARAGVEAYAGRELAFPPGTDYGYSSSGYNLLAALIETVAGMPIQAYVQAHVLTPLGLANTGYGDVSRPLPGLVRNYSYVDIWSYQPVPALQQVPTWDFSYNAGGGNMYATADDLLRLGQSLLDADRWPASRRAQWTARVAEDSRSRWSLGWIVDRDDAGRRIVYITGATPGVQAALFVYPDEDLVFVALANCWGRDSGDADLVMGAPQRLVAAYLARREP